ncbi:MAG: hypothetical protein KJ600_00630 [Nanoarchaeota archaeon]|nr:hypothetical protein [Nanoarchaeota archaeon]
MRKIVINPRNVFIVNTRPRFMYSTKTCELRCKSITPGAFSGERVCEFDIYEDGRVVQASPHVPKGYVDEGSKTVRVRAIRVQGDKTDIEFPGEVHFEVSSKSLVDLT